MHVGKFTIRLAAVVGLVVTSLFIYGVISRVRAASALLKDLESWKEGIDRTDRYPDTYTMPGIKLTSPENPMASQRLTVSTVQLGPPGQNESIRDEMGFYTEDPDRFYVNPPGVWVDDLDAVMRVWNEQVKKHVDQGGTVGG
ncbi:MAG: hypothetical protein AAGG48_27930 [Planctomycetota bacterium]